MDKSKRKNDTNNLASYWRYFLPLTIILALMVKFPLRIDLRESFFDVLFYGAISLICSVIAFRVYRRFGKHSHRLIVVILLCSILSGWQIFDLVILRTGADGSPPVLGFGSVMSPNFTDSDGVAWYNLRFPNDNIMCNSLYERYYGNYLIAITLEIDRNATWIACGG